MAKKAKRFVVYSEGMGMGSVKILMDKITGVHYLFYQDGSSGGLTVLLGNDGKPFIQKLPKDSNDA